MKTCLMLSSVIPDGITTDKGGFYAICEIYSFLLQDSSQNAYSNIFINQIGNELDEFISKKGRQVKMNYRTKDSLRNKTENERNILRLEFIHNALCLIANKYGELHIPELIRIKQLILERNFLFELVLKKFENKKNNYSAELSVVPLINNFEYWLTIKLHDSIKCKILIYDGLPAAPAYNYFFKFIQWKEQEKVILSGTEGKIETVVDFKNCTVRHLNLSEQKNTSVFDMFRFGISESERKMASKNYNKKTIR